LLIFILRYVMAQKSDEVRKYILEQPKIFRCFFFITNLFGHVRKTTYLHSKLASSSVQSAIRRLLDKDFVTMEQRIYSIYDLFLEYWIRRCY
ncbi:MAG: hypothetical protein MJZ20_12210, partial [Bacteroidaceae bacterium]|nr:hypothetical protein [Bacteroidaceae bacterium]